MQKTLQQLIEETPEGGVLHLGEVEYKESVTIAKNITIVGIVDDSDDPWYEYDYKTIIEGKIVVAASNPIFEACYFDFDDNSLILEKGTSPIFTKCRFDANGVIVEIKDENTDPHFSSCRFAGPTDDLGLCIKNGAKGCFEKCLLEFCSVSVQDAKTNPIFIDCSLNSVDCATLSVENGASGRFEDVLIQSEMDVDSLFIGGTGANPDFLKCNIRGFPYAVYIASGARPTFEECKIDGHSIDPKRDYSDYVVGMRNCSAIFASCDFTDVNTRVFRSKNVQIECINCKFNDLDERDFPDFRFLKNIKNPSLVKRLVAILSSQDVLGEIEKNKEEYFDFIDRYMVGCEHKNFHCEGDVWEHTKLVIRNVVAEKHDWIDVLTALLHDVGKKDALERNNGKNMHAHELFSEKIASEWFDRMGFGEDFKNEALWIIRNHMLALELKVIKSKFTIVELVRHPLFYRLARLARADCRGTLNEEGKPRDDFDEILKRPAVKDCRRIILPISLIDAKDFASQHWNNEQVEMAVRWCHKMMVHSHVPSLKGLVQEAIHRIESG